MLKLLRGNHNRDGRTDGHG